MYGKNNLKLKKELLKKLKHETKRIRNYLWGAATMLRGKIDAGDYKQFIFPLLFFKRICDVYDEEFQFASKK